MLPSLGQATQLQSPLRNTALPPVLHNNTILLMHNKHGSLLHKFPGEIGETGLLWPRLSAGSATVCTR